MADLALLRVRLEEHAGRAELVRLPARRNPPRRHQVEALLCEAGLGDLAPDQLGPHRLGTEVEHQGRLELTGVRHAAGRRVADVGGGLARERPVVRGGCEDAGVDGKLLYGLAGQGGVATVAVDHEQPPEAVRDEAAAELADAREKRGGGERQRPGEAHVVGGRSVRLRRRDEHGPAGLCLRGRRLHHPGAEERIGVEGQVRAVLLHRRSRKDGHGPLAVECLHLAPAEQP